MSGGIWLAAPCGRNGADRRELEPAPAGFRGRTVTVRYPRTDPPGRAGSRARIVWQLERLFDEPVTYRRLDVLAWAHAATVLFDREAGLDPPALTGANELYLAIRYLQQLGLELVCTYCDEPGTTVDHVLARANGGNDARANVTPACGSCNSSKRHVPVEAWLARRAPRTGRRLKTP